jgi:hypothetical protein
MLKKIYRAALIIFLTLCLFAIISCSSPPVTVDQSITPHDAALKAISELGYTEKDLSEFSKSSEPESGGKKIMEYYSEGSEDCVMDNLRFNVLFSSAAGDSVRLDMIEQYSIMAFDKDLPFPFELVIFKIPKTDGETDSELISKVKNLCADNINQHKKNFQEYLPKYTPYAEKADVKVTDNFVYYCMSENPSKVTAVIYNFLAGK